jgi:hypothetical protein
MRPLHVVAAALSAVLCITIWLAAKHGDRGRSGNGAEPSSGRRFARRYDRGTGLQGLPPLDPGRAALRAAKSTGSKGIDHRSRSPGKTRADVVEASLPRQRYAERRILVLLFQEDAGGHTSGR